MVCLFAGVVLLVSLCVLCCVTGLMFDGFIGCFGVVVWFVDCLVEFSDWLGFGFGWLGGLLVCLGF